MPIITRSKPRSNVYHDEDECKTGQKILASDNYITLTRKGQGKRTKCDRCQDSKARRVKAERAKT